MLHHCHWESATMSAELTVSRVACLTNWHDLSVDRKLMESQSGDIAQLLMHSAMDVTWSVSVAPAAILTPTCLFHSIPNNRSTAWLYFYFSIFDFIYRRWGGCVYVLQMFFCFVFFVFFRFFRTPQKYQTTVLRNGWTDFHETFTKR